MSLRNTVPLWKSCLQTAAQLGRQRKSDKPERHVVIGFCSARSSRAGGVQWEAEWRERERKLGALRKKPLLWRACSARVITQSPEENQEGTVICLRRASENSALVGFSRAGPALLQAPQPHAVISALSNVPTCLGSAGPGETKERADADTAEQRPGGHQECQPPFFLWPGEKA